MNELAAQRSQLLESAFIHVRKKLLAYLRTRVKPPVQAEDLMQEVLVKALSTLEKGVDIQHLEAWLMTAAKHTLTDHYRLHRHFDALSEDAPVTVDEEPLMHQQLAEHLMPFVEHLPDKYRTTLIAADLRGEKLKAIAEREGLSLSAVKSRVSRARQMLKQMLSDCCHIELSNGLVKDYYRRKLSACCE